MPRQREKETYLCRFNLSLGSSHNGFNNRTTFIMQKVDFINNNQADQLSVGSITTLASDDIPLLRSGDNDLSLTDLLFGHVDISRKFVDDDAVALQSLGEVLHDFLDESLHRSDVHDLEFALVHGAIFTKMETNLVHDGQNSHIGLTSTGRSAQQDVFLVHRNSTEEHTEE